MIDEPTWHEKKRALRPPTSNIGDVAPKPKKQAEDPPTRRVPQPASHVNEREILNSVRLYFKDRNWDAAIPLLFKLVDLDPKNASYRGFLAKAMFKHPTLRDQAEPQFLEAIQLRPLDAKLHMWLGLYYRSFGQSTRATTAFRTALELDPNNAVAKKYLLRGDSENEALC
jgi:tetratricopeptide (TPR) repeat protein